jgi:hypothetical protein
MGYCAVHGSKGGKCRKGERLPAAQPASGGRTEGGMRAGRNRRGFSRAFFRALQRQSGPGRVRGQSGWI